VGEKLAREMTPLLMAFRDKPSEAPALLIVTTSAATEAISRSVQKAPRFIFLFGVFNCLSYFGE